MPRINAFSRNENSINLKIFPHMVEYNSLRENSASILEREREIKPKGVYRNMKGCILGANFEGQGW